jgi:hypothetical protein
MSHSARYHAQRCMVQAFFWYLMGDRREAERLILQALTFTYPIGELILQTHN